MIYYSIKIWLHIGNHGLGGPVPPSHVVPTTTGYWYVHVHTTRRSWLVILINALMHPSILILIISCCFGADKM